MRVLCFGDSITQGFSDPEGGWVMRLWRRFAETNFEPTCFNLGISGDTSSGLLRRIEGEIIARQFPGEELLVMIAIGTNDTMYYGSENKTSKKEFVSNLESILSIVRKYTEKIIFIGLTEVDDSRLQPIPWSMGGECYSAARTDIFNKLIWEFCRKNGSSFVDLWSVFSGKIPQLTSDGIHPNKDGHELIAKVVEAELSKFL